MAYQNRIDITVETFKGLNNRASKVATQALKIFDDQSKLFHQINEMNSNASLIKKIPENLQHVSGIPGSQLNALKQVSSLMTSFITESNNAEQNANKKINSLKNEYITSLNKMNDFLTDMCSSSHQIDSIKNTIKEHQQNLPSKLGKYKKSITNIVSNKAKFKKSSEATNLMEKIKSIRSENPIYQKAIFVDAAEKCMNGISQNSVKAVQLIKKQFCTQKDILLAVIKSNQDIVDKCNSTSDKIIPCMNMINFQIDFQNFVSKQKIIRYDILPDQFVPLDFSHECFSQISTISNVLSLQLYPFAIARMKKEFNAKESNELSMQKGKMVLLMEDLSLPWAFIQNPYTRVMGYAPSSFLELVGKGIGVLLEEFTTSDEILNKGDYIAIIGDEGPGSKEIRTISDLTAIIPVSIIGIISEF